MDKEFVVSILVCRTPGEDRDKFLTEATLQGFTKAVFNGVLYQRKRSWINPRKYQRAWERIGVFEVILSAVCEDDADEDKR